MSDLMPYKARTAKHALKKIALLNLSAEEYEVLGLPVPKKLPDQSLLDSVAKLVKKMFRKPKAKKKQEVPHIWHTS